MAGFELTMRLVKQGTGPLLDRKLLEDRVQKANVRNLFRAAGLVKRIARQSIRRTKKSSSANEPPRHHTNPGLKLINFSVDSQREEAVVGVLRFAGANGIDVPHVTEYGGKMRMKRRPRKAHKKPKGNVYVRPRPFMGPAHETAQKKYPEFWRDCI